MTKLIFLGYSQHIFIAPSDKNNRITLQMALYPRQLLAMDAQVKDSGGFGGITLAQNVSSKDEVDKALSQAIKAGGSLLKEAQDTEWGGCSGYFADPDGHPWEVAWAPVFKLPEGKLILPD